jgi:hypothetical protein
MGFPAPLMGCGPGRTPGSTAAGVLCARAVLMLMHSNTADMARQQAKILKAKLCLTPWMIGTFMLSFLSFFLVESLLQKSSASSR